MLNSCDHLSLVDDANERVIAMQTQGCHPGWQLQYYDPG